MKNNNTPYSQLKVKRSLLEQNKTYIVRRIQDGEKIEQDFVSVEEPLEIVLEYWENKTYRQENLAVTMRTPGADDDLVRGFLIGEGIVDRFDQIEHVVHNKKSNQSNDQSNSILVRLTRDANFDKDLLLRHFYTSSSCGVCGKVSLAAVNVHITSEHRSDFDIAKSRLLTLSARLRKLQREFEKTGGLHASALFNREGEITGLREDVGRHNALDKLIGSCYNDAPDKLSNQGLLLSGRASFELLQKSAIAGIPLVASIGSPSSLAIDLARAQDITLIGFLSSTHFNIYHGDRVVCD